MNAADDQPTFRTVTLGGRGGDMAVLDFGPAERPVDVVFSHANGFNAKTYRSILGPLATELRILAPDLRGHGSNHLPTPEGGPGGWGVYADDLLALLSAATDRPVVLAGHSMGATSSLLAAALAPERVKALALFEPVLLPRPTEPPGAANRSLADGARRRRAVFADRAEALAAYHGRGAFRTWSEGQLADYLAAGLVEASGGGLRLACAPDWEAANFESYDVDPQRALEAVAAPIRMLLGDHGSTVRIEPAPRPDLSVETIAGASHFLPMERPELVREALRAAAA